MEKKTIKIFLDYFSLITLEVVSFLQTDVYIFREKIVHQVTQNMEIKVEDGKLSDILPGIRIYQNHGEVHHIVSNV